MIYDSERREMCRQVAKWEGCELGDGINMLLNVKYVSDHAMSLALLAAEHECEELLSDVHYDKSIDWEDYDRIRPEILKHFLGCKKWPQEEYDS